MERKFWLSIRGLLGFAPAAQAEPANLQAAPVNSPAQASASNPSDRIPLSLARGEVIAGRYLIRRPIGRGGMGEVYEAHDSFLKETVALKTLRASLADDAAVISRFQEEMQLARKVTHTNVCRVFETGLHQPLDPGQPPLPYFTMELLAGETLLARIRRKGPLARDEAFAIARQMAEGLAVAHAAGVVHSDFKSGNVILIPGDHGDRAVITDFGLAHVDPARVAPDETRTMVARGHVVGTMAYMSPEQMTGEELTPASDIYSFGIVLFEMATGRLPFDQEHAIHAAMQRASTEIVTARSLVPDLDHDWDTAIGRCLEKDPERRFASAADLADCFRERGWRVPIRYWRRPQWLRAAFVTAVPFLLVAGLWLWTHRPYQPTASALPWYQKGVAALHSMTYEAARKAFEQAVVADPAFALAHAGLAQADEELDYSDLAKESMLRALAVAQASRLAGRDALRLRGLQFVLARDYDRAAPVFRQLEGTAAVPDKPAAALESGWLAEKRDDTESAAADYQRALQLDPNYAPARLRLGYLLGRRRQLESALQSFRQAEDLYQAASNLEGVTEALYERARLLNRSSHSADALPVIDKALGAARAVGSHYQQVRLLLAQSTAVRNQGDAGGAGELARQAIDIAIAEKMDGVATNALIDFGNSYLFRGDLASAEPPLQRALEIAGRARVRPNEARARLALASLREQQNRPREARQFAEAALPFYRQAGYRRELVQAMTILGGAHHALAELDDADRMLREALDQAVQLHDRETEERVRERLSENLRDQARWTEALSNFEQLMQGDRAYALIHCGDLYWRLGRGDESRQALAEAEKLLDQPANRQLLFDLRMVQARIGYREGRTSQALAFSRQALAEAPAGDAAARSLAQLIPALVAVRARATDAAIASALGIADSLEQAGMLLDSVSARLEIADATLAATSPAPAARDAAAQLAAAALAFYEPRKIWEPVWRAHCLAGRASTDAADRERHLAAARSAIDLLKSLWPAGVAERYFRRPDINPLMAGWK